MPWRTAHASEPGTSHLARGTPCQDFRIVDESAGHLLVAVADGAGSAPLSARGAQVACTWAVNHLKTTCTDQISVEAALVAVAEAFEIARHEVEQAAASESASPRDLACTLLAAVLAPGFAVFGQVGDGAAIYDDGADLAVAHWPEQEALNLTDFLTSAPLEQTLAIRPVPRGLDRVAMMTDGLTHLLLDLRTRRPHAPALEKLFAACRASPDPAALDEDLRSFLNSGPVNDRSDDDKTLVIAVREPAS